MCPPCLSLVYRYTGQQITVEKKWYDLEGTILNLKLNRGKTVLRVRVEVLPRSWAVEKKWKSKSTGI